MCHNCGAIVEWDGGLGKCGGQLVDGFVSELVAQAQPDHLRPHATIQGARRDDRIVVVCGGGSRWLSECHRSCTPRWLGTSAREGHPERGGFAAWLAWLGALGGVCVWWMGRLRRHGGAAGGGCSGFP